jgi:hypothetical protein
MSRHHHQRFATMWGAPIAIGVLTAIGLVAALFSDGGFGDILAGVVLSVPVAVGVWFGWLGRS